MLQKCRMIFEACGFGYPYHSKIVTCHAASAYACMYTFTAANKAQTLLKYSHVYLVVCHSAACPKTQCQDGKLQQSGIAKVRLFERPTNTRKVESKKY